MLSYLIAEERCLWKMADSASESDSSSVCDGPPMQPPFMPPSPITKEQWQKRIDSLQQQNRVLKAEVFFFCGIFYYGII